MFSCTWMVPVHMALFGFLISKIVNYLDMTVLVR